MKTFGWICIIFGGLSLTGALSSGDSGFGLCFWLAVGIALVYFANHKNKKNTEKEDTYRLMEEPKKQEDDNNFIENTSYDVGLENTVLEVNKTQIEDCKTYWEQYKISNPQNAKEIESLGLCLDRHSDKDVKEKIFSLQTKAAGSNCRIADLKQNLFDDIETEISETAEYLYFIEKFGEQAKSEARKYNLDLKNTISIISAEWILEKIKGIESLNSNSYPRTNINPKELMMMFTLESSDENILFRKFHIYTQKFPMTEKNRKYVETIEQLFNKHFDLSLQPFVDKLNSEKASS